MNIWQQFQDVFVQGLKAIANALAFLGDHQWAAAIVLLTLIVRTLLLPLAVKQIRSMQAMARLQPEIERLKKKFRNDKQKLNEEMMALWKREGANPLGGCLPLVAQMPVLFAMYYAIQRITQPVRSGGFGIEHMPFLGLGNLADKANASVAGWLLLGLMTLTSILSARQMSASQSPEQARIAMIMPVFLVFIFQGFPAGLVLYWTTQNVYQYVQQRVMMRGIQPVPRPPRQPPGQRKQQPRPKPKGRR